MTRDRVFLTKEFLAAQIQRSLQAIYQNQGAINLCRKMIEDGCFVEAEKTITEEKKSGA